MSSSFSFRTAVILSLLLLLSTGPSIMSQQRSPQNQSASSGGEAPEWRTWTSQEGAEIEAHLKEVRPEGIVIVRRDGREFTAPLSRFSAADQAYVAEQIREEKPKATDFRRQNFENVSLPVSHDIDGVNNVRPGSGQPPEAGAIQTVLNFHNVTFGADLGGRVAARKTFEDQVVPTRGLINVLAPFPVDVEVLDETPRGNSWQRTLNAIRSAVTLDLPVLLAYRPLFEPETPEEMVIVVGYDRRNLNILEPDGGRRPVRLDVRTLDEQFIYALIVFPKPLDERSAAGGMATEPSPAFLSRLSGAIREAPTYEPNALTEFLSRRGLSASVRDVNRTDLGNQLGRTRSFARSGGLPTIETSLDQGNVVILPLEMDEGQGLALVYGRSDAGFEGVEFLPDRTFRREPIAPGDIATRWLTRENRTYRLDLIEIRVENP